MICGARTKFADEGLAITFTFFQITREIYQFGTCQFNINARNEKAIFRENFSSRGFDSGKIFKIIVFSCGPRTPYCTLNAKQVGELVPSVRKRTPAKLTIQGD